MCYTVLVNWENSMEHEHDREVDWVKQPGKRGVFFKVYCTKCEAESAVHQLPGHSAGRNGFPRDMAQACDDVLDNGDRYLP